MMKLKITKPSAFADPLYVAMNSNGMLLMLTKPKVHNVIVAEKAIIAANDKESVVKAIVHYDEFGGYHPILMRFSELEPYCTHNKVSILYDGSNIHDLYKVN